MRLTAIAISNRKTGRRLSECSPAEGIHGCQTQGTSARPDEQLGIRVHQLHDAAKGVLQRTTTRSRASCCTPTSIRNLRRL